MPRLSRVALNSSSNGTIRGLKGGRLDLSSEGSGNFDANGWVESVQVRFNGSGGADLRRLRAGNVTLIMNGSGTSFVGPTRSLVAHANGTATIHYCGQPARLDKDAKGLARVQSIKC